VYAIKLCKIKGSFYPSLTERIGRKNILRIFTHLIFEEMPVFPYLVQGLQKIQCNDNIFVHSQKHIFIDLSINLLLSGKDYKLIHFKTNASIYESEL